VISDCVDIVGRIKEVAIPIQMRTLEDFSLLSVDHEEVDDDPL